MAWPYLPSMVRIVIEYTIGGGLAINVNFAKLQSGGTPSAAELVNIADAAYDALDIEWIPFMASNTEVTDLTATIWEDDSGRVARPTGTLPNVGTDVGARMPAQVALVASLKTNFTGRDKVGRQYLLGFTEGQVSNDDADSALITAGVDYIEALNANYDTEGFDLGVYSLYEDGAPRTTPKFTPSNVFSVNARVDTQRRRLPNS